MSLYGIGKGVLTGGSPCEPLDCPLVLVMEMILLGSMNTVKTPF